MSFFNDMIHTQTHVIYQSKRKEMDWTFKKFKTPAFLQRTRVSRLTLQIHRFLVPLVADFDVTFMFGGKTKMIKALLVRCKLRIINLPNNIHQTLWNSRERCGEWITMYLGKISYKSLEWSGHFGGDCVNKPPFGVIDRRGGRSI